MLQLQRHMAHTAQHVPIDEKHPNVCRLLMPLWKIGADQLALSYWRSFSTPISVIRPFNTYGPRQSARAVIPTIISQIASGKNRKYVWELLPNKI